MCVWDKHTSSRTYCAAATLVHHTVHPGDKLLGSRSIQMLRAPSSIGTPLSATDPHRTSSARPVCPSGSGQRFPRLLRLRGVGIKKRGAVYLYIRIGPFLKNIRAYGARRDRFARRVE